MGLIDSLVGVFSGKIISEPTDMAAFLTDWRGKWTGVALAVVQPDSTEDVASIVRWCNENSVSVVPQGATPAYRVAQHRVPVGLILSSL